MFERPDCEPGERNQAGTLLARLRRFCFSGGEEAARSVTAIRISEKGEMRMSPEARWIPFTAEEIIETRRSSFRWQARLSSSRLTPITVTDAYENGQGYLTVKAAGLIPLKKITGAPGGSGRVAALPGLDCILPAHPAEPCRPELD